MPLPFSELFISWMLPGGSPPTEYLFLHHKSLGDDVSVNLICLRFADVIFPHGRSRKRIKYTDIVALRNKVADQVVDIISR